MEDAHTDRSRPYGLPRTSRRQLAGMVVVGLSLSVFLVVQAPLWLNPELQPAFDPGADTAVRVAQVQAAAALQASRAQAIATTRAAFVAGLAGLAALGTLWLNARTVNINQQTLEENREAQIWTLRLQNEGQVTDRYAKAIEQLGEPADEKLAIRLGGIYALERIAVDSERDHLTVVEVLSAFIRERTPEPVPLLRDGETFGLLPVDVRAALAVLGRLPRRKGVSRGDLSGAHLEGADLSGVNLGGANLAGVHLAGGNLSRAHLEKVKLRGAGLEDADMRGAWLQEANLFGARLQSANLGGAFLAGAHVEEANLSGAYLEGANLVGAHLSYANLRANLEGVNFAEANLERANLSGAHMRGANMVGASLQGVQGLVEGQLDRSYGDSRTALPSALRRPASWSIC